MVLLMIKYETEIFSWSDAADFPIRSLGMQYSVITTSEGRSIETVN